MQNLVNSALPGGLRYFCGTQIIEARERKTLSLTDTTVVLFFLALEIGAGRQRDLADFIVGGLVITAFAALPFFLTALPTEKFFGWLAGRIVVALAGVSTGIFFGMAVAYGAFPPAARFIPLSLLIVAGIIGCNVAIYGIIRNRLAR
ncbi:MAG: hypothetical protein ACK42A_02760 [Pyrinomonadaceae bacterium]